MTKKENRAHFKRHAFNHMPATDRTRAMKPPSDSWWLVGSAPGERDQFQAAAKQRALQRGWSNVIPYQTNPLKGFA